MICKKKRFESNEKITNVLATGYKSLVLCSQERKDELFADLNVKLPLKLHASCHRDYTNSESKRLVNKNLMILAKFVALCHRFYGPHALLLT